MLSLSGRLKVGMNAPLLGSGRRWVVDMRGIGGGAGLAGRCKRQRGKEGKGGLEVVGREEGGLVGGLAEAEDGDVVGGVDEGISNGDGTVGRGVGMGAEEGAVEGLEAGVRAEAGIPSPSGSSSSPRSSQGNDGGE